MSNPIGIYLHIPFCMSKCPYCDFYSLPYCEQNAQQYVGALLHALDTAPGKGREVDSHLLWRRDTGAAGWCVAGNFAGGVSKLFGAAGLRGDTGGKPCGDDPANPCGSCTGEDSTASRWECSRHRTGSCKLWGGGTALSRRCRACRWRSRRVLKTYRST